jgi:predicted kinase
LGRPDLVEPLIDAWAAAAGPHGVAAARHRPLLDHYVAYRAHVRAKVACLRWRQCPPHDRSGDEAAAEARALLALCDRRLDAARVRLVLVGGAPGAGKSTLATALSRRHGWTLRRSDVVRKQLAGLAPDAPAVAGVGEGIYTADWTERTYAAMREQAAALLARGHSVVLDASWTTAGQRAAARAVAEAHRADLVELRLDLAPAALAERVRSRLERGGDASDADEAVASALAVAADPWPEATTLGAAGAADVVLAAAEAALSDLQRRS